MRLSIAVLAAICVAFALSVPLPPAVAKQAWTVIAGGGTKDSAVLAQGFLPKTIEVGVGDTVTWKFREFHTVSFLSGGQAPPPFVQEGGRNYFNPQVFYPVGGKEYDGTGYLNSGTPRPNPSNPRQLIAPDYSLTFTKPGSYQYVCTVHPGMLGTVVVKDSAMGSPASAAAQANKERAAIFSSGLAAWAKLKPERMGRTVAVTLVGNNRARYSIMRFTRDPLVIRRGTTVTWKMADPFEIHTVTFLGGKRPKPGDEVFVEPQPQGLPKWGFRPDVERPVGGKSYASRGYVGSGILFTPPFGPPGAPTSYSLTFTRAGRYEYWCMVHIANNMKGTIVVR
jgi:plastocyanin